MRLTNHDPGYQPYVISANKPTWRAIYDKLCEYEDAEEQGRLVILPCRVGTPVWSSVLCGFDEDGNEQPAQWPFVISMMDEWGTGFFMTKEEAEAALKGGNGDV